MELEVSKFLSIFFHASDSKYLLFILIKIADISRTLALRNEWRINLREGTGRGETNAAID